MGTSAGSRLFISSGWRGQAGLSLGWIGAGFIILFLRGPQSKRWIGWDGGYRGKVDSAGGKDGAEGRGGGEVEKRLEEGQVESLEKDEVEGEGGKGSGGEDRLQEEKVGRMA